MPTTRTSAGLSEERLSHLVAVIEDDIARGKYHGAVVCIGRHGEIGLHEAIGFAYQDQEQPLQIDSVFNLLSVTKALTNVLIFRAIELGQLALTTTVSSVIPEFSRGMNDELTIAHLLTHQSGIPLAFEPRPGMYIDRLDEVIEAICDVAQVTESPGGTVNYSPMFAHALMGEMVRRLDPDERSYRDIVHQEIFNPLGMTDSSIGLRRDLRSRKVRPDFFQGIHANHLGHSDFGPHGAFEEEDAEMPWVGACSTAYDLFRFAEMLRRGGELDGARIISPTILDLATRNYTGDRPNELYKLLAEARGFTPSPAYLGLGFALRGEAICHHAFGTLTSPRTFGNEGAGSIIYWVDPELELTVSIVSAGVMDLADNLGRFQRLSDIVVSAAI